MQTDNEALQRIYERLAGGEEAARNELIEAAMPLAHNLAAHLAERMPGMKNNQDDLVGEAYLALTEVASKLTSKPMNVSKYLARSVGMALLEAIGAAAMIGPKHVTRWRRRIAAGLQPDEIEEGDSEEPEIESLDFFDEPPAPITDLDDAGLLIDFLFDECCQTDREAAVTCLRLEGQDYVEIAEELEIGVSTVGDTFKRVKDRFHKGLAV